jgi:hypothetical protein
LLARTRLASAAGDDPALTWKPAYSKVSGTLPPGAVPVVMKKAGFVRFLLAATTAGKVKLLLNSAKGLTLWVDKVPVEAKGEMVLDLASGVHTLTFAVDMGRRQEGLRCELRDVPGSKARVQIVGGK